MNCPSQQNRGIKQRGRRERRHCTRRTDSSTWRRVLIPTSIFIQPMALAAAFSRTIRPQPPWLYQPSSRTSPNPFKCSGPLLMPNHTLALSTPYGPTRLGGSLDENWHCPTKPMKAAEELDKLQQSSRSESARSLDIEEINDLIERAHHADRKGARRSSHILWRRAISLWHPNLGVEKPHAPVYSWPSTQIDEIIALRSAAKSLLRAGHFPAAISAMKDSRSVWNKHLGIALPRFSESEKRRLHEWRVEITAAGARGLLSSNRYLEALSHMRRAQLLWLHGSSVPLPTFSISEKEAIMVFCPDAELIARLPPKCQGYSDCPICHADAVDESFLLGPCLHSFHDACVSKWFLSSKKTTCPICRRRWIKDVGYRSFRRTSI